MSEQNPDIPVAIYRKILWMQLGVLRKERGFTQGDLAKFCGVKQVTISHIENGRSNPSDMLGKKLSEFFGFETPADFKKELEARIDWVKYEHLTGGIMSSTAGREFLKNRPSLLSMTNQRPQPRKRSLLNFGDKQPSKKSLLNFAGQNVESTDGENSVDGSPSRLKKYHAITDIKGNRFLSTGVYVSDPEPQYLDIPPILKGVKDAYAIQVHDSSMEPRYSIGDTVLVNPELLATPGDDVVVQLVQGNLRKAVVRRLEHLFVNFDALKPLADIIKSSDTDANDQNEKIKKFITSDEVQSSVHRRFLLADISMVGSVDLNFAEERWSKLKETYLVIEQMYSGKSQVSGQGEMELLYSTLTGVETENAEITEAAIHPIVACYRREKSAEERAQAYKQEIGKLN